MLSYQSSTHKGINQVLSGKGGVGKSSVTTQLALSLSLAGQTVGVLDVDLTGPSIPRMFKIEDAKVIQSPLGWVPVTVHSSIETETEKLGSLQILSLAFLLKDRGDAVVWRGPKKTAMVRQFLSDVNWNTLDYLLIDTPPGTGDELISLLETLLATPASPDQLAGAVVVTTPQAVATADVRKSLNFCTKTHLRVIGIIENMSGFVCPHCSECTDLFRSNGGRLMAEDFGVLFLGGVPIDPEFVMLVEAGNLSQSTAATAARERDTSNLTTADASEGERGGKDRNAEGSALLVHKYQKCSLAPIFQGITHKIVTAISSAEP